MKLYQFEINSGSGPKFVKTVATTTEAGAFCFEQDHEANLFMLLHDGKLYYYVDTSGGFGWEASEGEDGPAFCAG